MDAICYVNKAGDVLCGEHLLDAMVDAEDELAELDAWTPVAADDDAHDVGDCIACRADLQADAYSVASAATY